MNILVILVISLAVLICGYIFYGGWLSRQWGVGESKEPTPAHTMEDGVDYVPAKAPVLMGHHFSSIAGAGPINGPIQAAVFGWVPVLLWVLIGGIFFGGVHDFGALFASIRNKGQSIGEIIGDTMGATAKRLFLLFAWLTLLLVVAAFASIVANTFAYSAEASAITNTANESTAMISLLFIALAIVFGLLVYRKNVPLGIASVIGVAGIVAIVLIGLNWHPIALGYNTWMWILGVYILIASVTPVWILLQPRDYLSSFLLYFMIIVGIVGVVGAAIMGGGNTDIPAFNGWSAEQFEGNKVFTSGNLFPALFVTIACGAISGFHSLVSSGTTSKQLDKETDAKPIAYGSMLIECAVAVVSLCAVGYVWNDLAVDNSTFKAPTQVFATGLSTMIGSFSNESVQNVMYQMLILAVSVFCLTSLDTATRLARYMFQEFWLRPGESVEDASGAKKVLTNKYFATILTVILGIGLGLTGYTQIWPLFGAANQLLAALGLIAVAAWLGNVGRNNKMFYVPMVFMTVVTITSLIQTIIKQSKAIAAGTVTTWGPYAQVILAVFLVALAVILVVVSFGVFKKQSENKKAGAKA
ncbi:MAG: carbon starvation protein A [Lachnospiraceae bacterium]|jgi:carbon starvation protein